jgi:hypothetical protein
MLFRNKHTSNYEFPTLTLYNGDTFDNAKQKLFLHLCKERFKVFYPNNYPIASVTRNFNEHELKDPKNKLLKGVRTFYFPAFHYRGGPCITLSAKNDYDDFVFAPKMEINKHINRDYFGSIINALHEK